MQCLVDEDMPQCVNAERVILFALGRRQEPVEAII